MKMANAKEEKKGTLNDFVVYQADPGELKEACLYHAHILEDKIEELENFCHRLKAEEFKVQTFNQWFEAKKLKKCRIHRLLAFAIRSHNTPEEKSKACLAYIKNTYKTDLVRQYKPLILCMMSNPNLSSRSFPSKKRTNRSFPNTLTINGERINLDRVYTEDEFLELFTQELSALGFSKAELHPSLKFYCLLIANEANNYSDVFLNKNRIGRCVQSNDLFIDCDAKNSSIQVHAVRNITVFYRINEGETDQMGEEVPESIGMPILAKSTASFQLNLRSSTSHGGFFELKPDYFDIVCSGAVLEVYDANARSVIVRDLSRVLSKKIGESEVFDANDQIAIRHLTIDYENITDITVLINKLIADKNALKLVLVMRINRLLILEVFNTPELMLLLCSDPQYMRYLQLLKLWHMQDNMVVERLSALLDYIRIVNSGYSQSAWEETILNLLFREKDESNLSKFSALFTLLSVEMKRSVLFLVTTPRIRGIIEDNNWIFLSCLYFKELAIWFFTTGYVSQFNLSAQGFVELMIAHPVLWDELRKLKSPIRDLPEQLLKPDQLGLLLVQNENKHSRDSATTAVNRSKVLFDRLCLLADTVPEDLLKYFTRYHKSFRANWPEEYKKTEQYLLSVCKSSSVARYFETYYRSLKDSEFCQLFCEVVIEQKFPRTLAGVYGIAREELITVFLHGLKKKRKFDSVYDTSFNLFRLSELLRDDPRLVSLGRLDSVNSALRDHPNRDILIAFVTCLVNHHSNPRINNVNNTRALFNMLRDYEAQSFIQKALNSMRDRFFILKLLIQVPDAIGLLILSEIDFQSNEFDALLSSASAEHLLLLLMALHSRQKALEKTLASYLKMPEELRQTCLAKSDSIKKEIEMISQIQRSILDFPEKLECFFDPTQSTWVDIACLISLYPELEDRIDPESLDTTQGRNYNRAKAFVQIRDHADYQQLTDVNGLNTIAFVRKLNDQIVHDSERFYSLINTCLLIAFRNNDIRVAILTAPDLLAIIIGHADLRLVAKFVVVFGGGEIPDELIKCLSGRLMKEPALLQSYRPFIYLGKDFPDQEKEELDQNKEVMSLEDLSWSMRHSKPHLGRKLKVSMWSKIVESASTEQVVALMPYCEESLDSLKDYLETLSHFEYLSASQLLNLLILTHHLNVDTSGLKGWFEYRRKPEIVCQSILNQRLATGFVLYALQFLLQYYPEGENLVDEHMTEVIDFDSCKRADVGRIVGFLVSELGLEVVFPEKGDVPRDLEKMICELFFLCDLPQLKLFVRIEYVKILIQNIQLFNTDAQLNQQYFFPRITLILIMLYEVNPEYVEQVFEGHQPFIESFKSSPASMQLILSSAMYETNEKIRSLFNIRLLEDDNIFIESSPPVRQNVGRVSSLQSQPTRSPLRRKNRTGHLITVPGSSGDSEMHSSSSFNNGK